MESIATNHRVISTDIPNMSKIEAGEMEISHEHVNAVPLIFETAEIARILVGTKPVTVEVITPTAPVIITTDSIKLRQIIMYLVSNAVKFTGQGKIAIVLSLIGNRLEVTVSDTGTGFQEEDVHKLFAAFSRVEDTKIKRQEGMGPGLTISINLAEPLSGTVTITSTYGKGTTFVVSLPLQQVDRQRGLYNSE
jgi:signal transduction histidine kinase